MSGIVWLLAGLLLSEARAEPEDDIRLLKNCFIPYNGAKLALVRDKPYDAIDQTYLEKLTMSDKQICIDSLPKGAVLVYQSASGTFTKMKVLSAEFTRAKNGAILDAKIKLENREVPTDGVAAVTFHGKPGAASPPKADGDHGAEAVDFSGKVSAKPAAAAPAPTAGAAPVDFKSRQGTAAPEDNSGSSSGSASTTGVH